MKREERMQRVKFDFERIFEERTETFFRFRFPLRPPIRSSDDFNCCNKSFGRPQV